MKKIISIIIALVMSMSISSFAFAEKGTTPAAGSKAEVPQELKDKKAQLKALFEEAKSIRSELETLKGQIRTHLAELRDVLKDMPKEEKAAAKEHIKELWGNIKNERTQIEALRAQLKLKTEAMQVHRAELKDAVKGAEYDTAISIIDKMIQIRTEKISDLQNILDLKNKMIDEVK